MMRYRLLAVMLIIIAVAVVAPAVSTASPQHQTFSASLTPIGGLVQILPSGKSDWQTVNQVTLINEGDQIRTGDQGLAKLNVVTGTQVDVLPSTLVELNSLSLASGMKFSLVQLMGATDTTVSQTVKSGDSLQVTTPTFTSNIRGTKFLSFTLPDGSSLIVGEEGTVELKTADGQTLSITPNDPVFESSFEDGVKVDGNTKPNSSKDADKIKAFLKKFEDANPKSKDLIDALVSGNETDAGKLAKAITDFLASYAEKLKDVPLCTADSTAEGCSVADPNLKNCGDNICALDQGETIINCQADCQAFADMLTQRAKDNAGANQGGGGTNPPDTTGNGTGQGNGAGVGRNPGPIISFSTSASGGGGTVCVVTTTANVNMRATDTGAVIGAVPSGVSLQTSSFNNNGWIVSYNGQNGSIASNFTVSSAGCPAR